MENRQICTSTMIYPCMSRSSRMDHGLSSRVCLLAKSNFTGQLKGCNITLIDGAHPQNVSVTHSSSSFRSQHLGLSLIHI